MIKNSTELIECARDALARELVRCIERRNQPSYMEMYYEGYGQGVIDAKCSDEQVLRDIDQWHYIETEGLPEENAQCILLLQCDGYKDVECGLWMRKQNEVVWNLSWQHQMSKVIAWHKIPYIPD